MYITFSGAFSFWMTYLNVVYIVQSVVRIGDANEGYMDMKIKRIWIRKKWQVYDKLHKFSFLIEFIFFWLYIWLDIYTSDQFK